MILMNIASNCDEGRESSFSIEVRSLRCNPTARRIDDCMPSDCQYLLHHSQNEGIVPVSLMSDFNRSEKYARARRGTRSRITW